MLLGDVCSWPRSDGRSFPKQDAQTTAIGKTGRSAGGALVKMKRSRQQFLD